MRLTCILALAESFSRHYAALVGGVAEWSNAPVLKTDEGESPPRVRIPVPPPSASLGSTLFHNPVNYCVISARYRQAFGVMLWLRP